MPGFNCPPACVLECNAPVSVYEQVMTIIVIIRLGYLGLLPAVISWEKEVPLFVRTDFHDSVEPRQDGLHCGSQYG